LKLQKLQQMQRQPLPKPQLKQRQQPQPHPQQRQQRLPIKLKSLPLRHLPKRPKQPNVRQMQLLKPFACPT
jgi:hypothetical protein